LFENGHEKWFDGIFLQQECIKKGMSIIGSIDIMVPYKGNINSLWWINGSINRPFDMKLFSYIKNIPCFEVKSSFIISQGYCEMYYNNRRFDEEYKPWCDDDRTKNFEELILNSIPITEIAKKIKQRIKDIHIEENNKRLNKIEREKKKLEQERMKKIKEENKKKEEEYKKWKITIIEKNKKYNEERIRTIEENNKCNDGIRKLEEYRLHKIKELWNQERLIRLE